MKTFRFRFESKTGFSTLVRDHSFLLRAFPMEDFRQSLVSSHLEVRPQPDSLSQDHDCWDARLDYGYLSAAHDSFSYVSEGIVKVEAYPLQETAPSSLYIMESKMTAYVPKMDILRPHDVGTAHERSMVILSRVRSVMSYAKGSTCAETTAAHAMEIEKGVCQDFAHIMISVCRASGIPARYVCGLIPGEGETHAWVEIWSDGSWYGLDPTAGKICDDSYIAIAKGRDAADCPVIRGLFKGCALQSTITMTSVEETKQ